MSNKPYRESDLLEAATQPGAAGMYAREVLLLSAALAECEQERDAATFHRDGWRKLAEALLDQRVSDQQVARILEELGIDPAPAAGGGEGGDRG